MTGRPTVRWIERGLWLVGLAAIAFYLLAFADSRLYQVRESRRLERAIAEAAEAQGPGSASRARGATLAALGATEAAATASGQEGADERDLLIGRIEIPRVGISAIVADGIDNTTLRRAVGRIPGTARPGEPGNVGLAGHRDTYFAGLRDIREGDLITLETPEGSFRYEVDSTVIVEPGDTHVLDPTVEPMLTLVTCYPFQHVGAAPERFIVHARELGAGPVATAP